MNGQPDTLRCFHAASSRVYQTATLLFLLAAHLGNPFSLPPQHVSVTKPYVGRFQNQSCGIYTTVMAGCISQDCLRGTKLLNSLSENTWSSWQTPMPWAMAKEHRRPRPASVRLLSNHGTRCPLESSDGAVTHTAFQKVCIIGASLQLDGTSMGPISLTNCHIGMPLFVELGTRPLPTPMVRFVRLTTRHIKGLPFGLPP